MKIIVTETNADTQDYVLNGRLSHKETLEFSTKEDARAYVKARYEKVCESFVKGHGIKEKSYYHDVKYGTCYAMVLSDKYIWDACVYLL